MVRQALGMIEAVGLPVAITAADAAVKSANVKLVGYELAKGSGMILIKVVGDVGAVKAAVEAGSAAAFVATRPGHWRCDLPALARRRLAGAGVARVEGGGFDTFRDERFYSYRRERDTGRFATLVWIA